MHLKSVCALIMRFPYCYNNERKCKHLRDNHSSLAEILYKLKAQFNARLRTIQGINQKVITLSCARESQVPG